MSAILAAIDASAAARPVLDVATAMGQALRLAVVALHVRQDDAEPQRLLAERVGVHLRLAAGSPAEAIVAALTGEDVSLAAGFRRGAHAGRAVGP